MDLFFTAVAVSIDAYLVGIAAAFEFKERTKAALSILWCVFAVSFTSFILGSYAMRTGRLFSLLGGAVFLVMGAIKIASVFAPKSEMLSSRRKMKGMTCLALGFGVSVDCIPACAFFAVLPLSAALWAGVIALMHATFFTCGALCFSLDKRSAMMDNLAGWTLVVVGLLKMARV